MTSITFFQSHLAFNIFIPEHNGFQRKRNGDALMDICNIHRYSLFLVLLFFFFFHPIQSKITILSFVSRQIENPEFCDREALLEDVEGTESAAVPSAADPRVIAED